MKCRTLSQATSQNKANSTSQKARLAPTVVMQSASDAKLFVSWCSHSAARYAVMNWHYSKRMPMPPLVRVGVWEHGKFVGCVLFGRGASPYLGKPFGLSQVECCELVRIALTSHNTPVTRIVKFAIRLLRDNSPNLRCVVSFADSREGHHGGIYQGGNWVYVGRTSSSIEYFHGGRWKHAREVTGGAFGGQRLIKNPRTLPSRVVPGKHKYVMPLDSSLAPLVLSMKQPYPKRACSVVDSLTAPSSVGVRPDQHALDTADEVL
jgi:hypothetical protein